MLTPPCECNKASIGLSGDLSIISEINHAIPSNVVHIQLICRLLRRWNTQSSSFIVVLIFVGQIHVTPIRNSDWRSDDDFQTPTPTFVTNNRKMRKKNDR